MADSNQLREDLIALSEAPGVAGYEHAVREIVEARWNPFADDMEVDTLGNLTATLHGSGDEPRPRILISAHMDEIGLMVTRVEDGWIRFTSVGGIDRRVLMAQPVIVHGADHLPGLIGSRPPHVLSADDRKQYPDYDDLVIDTGLPADQVAAKVQVGDIVTFDQRAVALNNGWISGKAMDNRASLACLTRLLKLLDGRRLRWDVLIAATTQEEVGLKGGATLAYGQNPDIAIAVDTTWGIGTGVGEDKGFKLGEGPTLVIGPEAHPALFEMVRETAQSLEIPLRPEPAERGSGTEATSIRLAREGVPVVSLLIPIRNMHTPVEIVALKDIERVARLLAAFVEELDDTALDKLTAFDD